MNEESAPPLGAKAARAAWAWTLGVIGLITLVRVAGLFLSPIELYPEEAQYWLWSRHLALGYFSKPPMVAWAIWATTRLGDGEPFVRLAAPLAHGLAALALQRAGARFYSPWTGLWAALIYTLAPGVQLSAAVIATDCLVMAFAALATWSYAAWLTSQRPKTRLGWAALLGLALGLGALAKYAIVYLALGIALHAALSGEVRRRWRPAELALVIGVALLALSPNLVWNAAHGFQTVAHTAHSADWESDARTAGPARTALLDPRKAPGFLVSQFAVFGPIPFLALLIGWAGMMRRRRPADVALTCLAAPALALILIEAVLARANANWAAVAYVPGSVLVAGWLARRGMWGWLAATLASEGLLLIVFLAAAVSPAFADRIGLSNSFKRARGWEAVSALVTEEARRLGPATLSAIAVDDRFTFNALSYYGRRSWPAGAPPLTMWVRQSRPHNEAEAVDPLSDGRRVLFVDIDGRYLAEAMRDFVYVRPLGGRTIHLDRKHVRWVGMFLGEDYRRRPRDPQTGLPVPP